MTSSMVQLGKIRMSGKEPSIENNLETTLGASKVKLPKLQSQSLVKIDYLKESRIHRLKIEKDKKLKLQMSEVEEKIRETIPLLQEETPTEKGKQNKKKEKNLPPIDRDLIESDIKFLFNPNYDGLDSPRLQNPPEEKFLFVTKPIGSYEPADVLMN